MIEDRHRKRVWLVQEKRMAKIDSLDYDTGDVWILNKQTGERDAYHVQPDTAILLDCTGFKDSEGNLIYESDIVRIRFADERSNYISPVMWKYGAWCIYHENRVDYQTGERACVGFGYWTKEALKGVTLLGNIYQDPSLLEADKK